MTPFQEQLLTVVYETVDKNWGFAINMQHCFPQKSWEVVPKGARKKIHLQIKILPPKYEQIIIIFCICSVKHRTEAYDTITNEKESFQDPQIQIITAMLYGLALLLTPKPWCFIKALVFSVCVWPHLCRDDEGRPLALGSYFFVWDHYFPLPSLGQGSLDISRTIFMLTAQHLVCMLMSKIPESHSGNNF